MLLCLGLSKRGIRSTFYTAYAYKTYRAHINVLRKEKLLIGLLHVKIAVVNAAVFYHQILRFNVTGNFARRFYLK